MTSDVVLTAALRNNLLSLQNTQRLIDSTQLKLATGLKVNSALDNPQNFFSSQALNNRASDLGRLLDGISQSIRTIEEADNGVTALTSLIEQADSIVQSARDELAASEGEARLVGDVDLSDVTDLTTLTGIADGDGFTIFTTDDDGQQISEAITINTGDTAETLAAKITDSFADNENGEVEARVIDGQYLEVSTGDGRTFRIQDNAAGTDLTLAGFDALGFGNQFANEDDGAGGAAVAAATITSGASLTSIAIYEADGDLIEAGDTIIGTDYIDADGNTILSGTTLAANDTISFTVNGNTETLTLAATTTFQDLVDEINDNASNIGDDLSASFDSLTGQITLTSLTGDATNVEITVDAVDATNSTVFDLSFGDPTGNLDSLGTFGGGNAIDRTYAFSKSTVALESYASDYNEVRNQIDRIVVDANYRGVNLLSGDDLTTFFNEFRTSSLTTEGVNFTADGLGILETNFANSAVVESVADSVRGALEQVRSFGSTLANNLSIIQTRRDFTEQTINTLTAGADDLVVADQNEEGANLLALQTRQALGTTSLSLASQSQQSVLRLF